MTTAALITANIDTRERFEAKLAHPYKFNAEMRK
jgi:hypothetical protein